MTKFVRDNPLITFFAITLAGSWLVWSIWYLSYEGMGFIKANASPTVLAFTHVIGLFAGPFLAALVVSRIVDGPGAPLALVSRMFQWRENPLWYVVALFAVPVAVGAGYVGIVGTPGTPSASWTIASVVLLFIASFAFGPVQEEVGFRGFALPRMQKIMHPAVAAVLLGLFVFLYELPLMVTWAWDKPYHTFTDIGVYALFLVAASIVFCALRNLAHGSLLFPILAYTGINWALIAAPIISGEPLHNLFAATFGLWVLAAAALALTGGRLGADVPVEQNTPLVELAQDMEAAEAGEASRAQEPAKV
ncbi:MAG: CPBP family intramembrane metalloprotease [Dermatophilus congolensis]|nr:CPBP family intramembrane metalloprotease [Dermatophilus congolensis]